MPRRKQWQPPLFDDWSGREIIDGPDQLGRYTYIDRHYDPQAIWCGACGKSPSYRRYGFKGVYKRTEWRCEHIGTDAYYRRGQVFHRPLPSD